MINYKKYFLLNNKTVLINGGLGLLGSEIARASLSLGSNVIIIDNDKLNKQKFLKTINKKYIQNIQVIISDSSSITHINKIFKKFKQNKQIIDVFINCSYPRDIFWSKNNYRNISHKSLSKNISLHTTSYIWFSKIVADYMFKNKTKGSIILLGSIYGVLAQNEKIYEGTNMSENLTYNFVKGGLINFCRSMAAYYAKYSIRVNCLSPGAITGHVSGESLNQSKIFIDNYLRQNPTKRLGEPRDVASACLFLSSDSSSYINGTNMIVDGGWTIV